MFSLLVAKAIKVLTTHQVQVLVKRRANKQNIYEFQTITVAAKFLYFFLIFFQKHKQQREKKEEKEDKKENRAKSQEAEQAAYPAKIYTRKCSTQAMPTTTGAAEAAATVTWVEIVVVQTRQLLNYLA